MASETRFCSKCGGERQDDDPYCARCGSQFAIAIPTSDTTVDEGEYEPPQSPRTTTLVGSTSRDDSIDAANAKKAGARGIGIIVLLIGAAVAGFGVIMAINGTPDPVTGTVNTSGPSLVLALGLGGIVLGFLMMTMGASNEFNLHPAGATQRLTEATANWTLPLVARSYRRDSYGQKLLAVEGKILVAHGYRARLQSEGPTGPVVGVGVPVGNAAVIAGAATGAGLLTVTYEKVGL